MSFFLFETEKRSRTAERARRQGEKVPRMAPSASVDGPAGADTMSATRGLRVPLELKTKIEAKDTHSGVFFLFETEKRSRTAKRARRRGEKVPRMAPSASKDGPAGADTTSATRGLRHKTLNSYLEKPFNLP